MDITTVESDQAQVVDLISLPKASTRLISRLIDRLPPSLFNEFRGIEIAELIEEFSVCNTTLSYQRQPLMASLRVSIASAEGLRFVSRAKIQAALVSAWIRKDKKFPRILVEAIFKTRRYDIFGIFYNNGEMPAALRTAMDDENLESFIGLVNANDHFVSLSEPDWQYPTLNSDEAEHFRNLVRAIVVKRVTPTKIEYGLPVNLYNCTGHVALEEITTLVMPLYGAADENARRSLTGHFGSDDAGPSNASKPRDQDGSPSVNGSPVPPGSGSGTAAGAEVGGAAVGGTTANGTSGTEDVAEAGGAEVDGEAAGTRSMDAVVEASGVLVFKGLVRKRMRESEGGNGLTFDQQIEEVKRRREEDRVRARNERNARNKRNAPAGGAGGA